MMAGLSMEVDCQLLELICHARTLFEPADGLR